MTTVLQARPRGFVTTPSIDRVSTRALRYLQSGFPVHLRGPAGTGKTTMALHLADLLGRPIMLLFGDDEFKTSDLIGNQSGYTRKKVVDNFIHSVVKMEDELRHNWVDSRLTLACREGFTLVYDEFNRSRPEVNNVLLSALEEKLLVLPPNGNRTEYIRVNPNFRAIFTSNPEEYCGVHDTQDALLDRLITINVPEPDELTQREITTQRTGLDRQGSAIVVRLVRLYRQQTNAENSSGLRSCLMIAKICQEHGILVAPENDAFRDICQDILLSRTGLPIRQATQQLWDVFNGLIGTEIALDDVQTISSDPIVLQQAEAAIEVAPTAEPPVETIEVKTEEDLEDESEAITDDPDVAADAESANQNLATDVASDASQELADTLEPNLDHELEPQSEHELDEFAEAIALSEPSNLALSDHLAPTSTEQDQRDLTPASEAENVGSNIGLNETVEAIATVDPTSEAPSSETQDQDPQLESAEISHSVHADAADVTAVSSLLDAVGLTLSDPHQQAIYQHLRQVEEARPSEIESALGINRFQTVNALRALADKGLLDKHNGTDNPASYSLKYPNPEGYAL